MNRPLPPTPAPPEYVEKPLKLVLKVGGSEVTELSTGSSGHDSSLFEDKSEHDKHRDRKRKKRKKGEKQGPGEEKGRKRRRVKVSAAAPAPGGPGLAAPGASLKAAPVARRRGAEWERRPPAQLRAHQGRELPCSEARWAGLRPAANGIRPGPPVVPK